MAKTRPKKNEIFDGPRLSGENEVIPKQRPGTPRREKAHEKVIIVGNNRQNREEFPDVHEPIYF
jgi:hypothetical protein